MYNLCRLLCIGLGALATLLVGCGGAGFGEDIRVSAEDRHTVKAAPVSGKPIELPKDHTFNIHTKNSDQNPGPNGKARGDSDATNAGNAWCLANASDGGSASAQFSVGHRIENHTGKGQNVAIEVNYMLTQKIQASKAPESNTLATTNLQLVVRDSRKKILAKTALAAATSDQAVAGANTKDQRTLNVQFEPGLSYDIMIYGKVDASSADKQKASARLDVKNLKIKLTFSPATSQPGKT